MDGYELEDAREEQAVPGSSKDGSRLDYCLFTANY